MTTQPSLYHRHRFPAEIISHAVWLYHLFSLSLRDIELILAERGVVVTHESIRHWCRKFGAAFAKRLRRRRPRPGDTWHLDDVFIRLNGVLQYLGRAVDQHGVVLDILVQDKRDGAAAKRFFKRLLHGLQYQPKRIITDGLRSYGVARRALLPNVKHRTSRYLNNRAENSHRPTRRRERQMQRFKSSSHAQSFLSAHCILYGHFQLRRHRMTAGGYRRARAKALRIWRQRLAPIKQNKPPHHATSFPRFIAMTVNLPMLSIAAIIFDLDHFKKLNDQHGHSAGDAVLRDVVSAILSSLRTTDVACRYGGEELAILLPDCTHP